MKGAIAVAAAASMASACSLVFSPSKTDNGSADDAGTPDVPLLPDGNFDCTSWGTRTYFDACDLPAAGPRLRIENPGLYQFDTDTLLLSHPDVDVDDIPPYFAVVMAQRDGSEVAVISTIDFFLGRNVRLRAFGPRPLLIASWGPIELEEDAVLDLSSYLGAIGSPAGATSGACTGDDAGLDQAGGGGGGMGSVGGTGGNEPDGTDSGGAGGQSFVPTGLIGGCDGGAGSPKTGRETGESAGGGAIALSALGSITIAGEIHAGGGGGKGGPRAIGPLPPGGGDGGGSGGMIVLEAPAITQPGEIDAIGGGGGGGGNDLDRGQPGFAGWAPGPLLTPGAGGTGAGGLPAGGDGGNGSNGTDVPGGDGEDADKISVATGGGGGGAAGQVVIVSGF